MGYAILMGALLLATLAFWIVKPGKKLVLHGLVIPGLIVGLGVPYKWHMDEAAQRMSAPKTITTNNQPIPQENQL